MIKKQRYMALFKNYTVRCMLIREIGGKVSICVIYFLWPFRLCGGGSNIAAVQSILVDAPCVLYFLRVHHVIFTRGLQEQSDFCDALIFQ